MNLRIKLWLPVLIWAGVIFYFSSLPTLFSVEKNTLDFLIKKGAHVTEYAIFYYLLYSALSAPAKGKKLAEQMGFNNYQLTFLIGLFYAFTDETHQLFTPGRTGLLRDVLMFDLLGLILAWLIIYRKNTWRR